MLTISQRCGYICERCQRLTLANGQSLFHELSHVMKSYIYIRIGEKIIEIKTSLLNQGHIDKRME